jgi:hypothetical protein
MQLEVQPQLAAMRDPDDFTSLSVVVPQHVWITRAEFERLAGDRAGDPAWREGFERMLAYAASKGWTDESGAVRAHVELA